MLDRFMGVDISRVGGDPADSRIDGEKGPKTSVGDAKNSTKTADEEHQKQLDEAKWAAYYKSGEIVLVIVVIGVIVWGYWIWRERRRGAAYSALADHDLSSRPNGHRAKSQPGDLESAAFDESELDDLHVTTPGTSNSARFPANHDSSEKFVTKYAE
jgi:carboxypeptidase D